MSNVARSTNWLSAGLIAMAVITHPVAAQDKKGPQSPVGGGGTPAAASDAAANGITLDAAQTETVKKVSAYFNTLDNLKGAFLQTNADGKKLRGKFFMKKPGRVRFEYSPPSKQLIISDGEQISIQDLDINTDDRVMVDQTPFRVLLKKDVDLLRDARILDVQEASDLVIVALQDKSKDASGKVRLFLATSPALELKEWVTTDAQGLDTRIEVSGLDKTAQIEASLFKIVSPSVAPKGQ
ncbi:MAG: outer-membrane lipoprotein carrier protein LolA [Proteobacteria bacterium]|nr:outer-membrane lipoprotein carrier protein LolA [Pseudomonadota bacterium]